MKISLGKLPFKLQISALMTYPRIFFLAWFLSRSANFWDSPFHIVLGLAAAHFYTKSLPWAGRMLQKPKLIGVR